MTNDTTESSLAELADRYGVEYLQSVPDEMLDPALVVSLPVEWARSHVVLPVRWKGRLCALTCDPASLQLMEDLAILLGGRLEPVVSSRSEILRSIERCYYRREHSPGEFVKELETPLAQPHAVPQTQSEDLLQATAQAPVSQLVNLILLEAVKARASDIHFEPFESSLRVRYRVDGVLYEKSAPPKHMESALIARLKVMGKMDIAETRLPQDGMARVRVGEREIDIRVSTVPVAEGERVVLRLLDRDSTQLPMESLGMSNRILAALREVLRQSNGVIIVCGPTGSGKTTTLYAALGQMDAKRRNIMTIEEPIEYQLPDIGQMQVKPKIGLTFATSLRHILRQDPDVVLVGEIRDSETADIAVRASLTGHLVLTTLHTNDAMGAVMRLVDMGVERYLLASCLRAVLAQRLVRRLCPACKRESAMPEVALEHARRAGIAGRVAWQPVGCPSCLEGYSGRCGVFEFLKVDPALQEHIRLGAGGGADAPVMSREMTLVADGMDKVCTGATSWDEVRTVLSL